jgi:hypothetical protein
MMWRPQRRAQDLGEETVGVAHERFDNPPVRAGPAPRPRAVAATERSTIAAVPSSSGCASGAGAWT